MLICVIAVRWYLVQLSPESTAKCQLNLKIRGHKSFTKFSYIYKTTRLGLHNLVSNKSFDTLHEYKMTK